MFRKIVFAALMMLLMTPMAGSAANMQVTSSALPATGGSITPNGLKFFSGAASYTISVNSGWSIGSILIDGVASAIATTKTVPFDTSKTHTIKVTFTQSSYSITTSAGTGGQIQITGGAGTNITAGSSRTVLVSSSTGYRILSYRVDGGVAVVPANPTLTATIPFNNITANHSVSATFELVPVVTAYAGADQTIGVGPNGTATTTLSGSASSNSGAITYLWAVVSKPSGATTSFATPSSVSTTFSADKTGTYAVTLTATSGGLSVTSAPATITVTSATMAAASSCISCHAGQAQVIAWLSSIHATGTTGTACPSCHMPNNEAHPGQAVANMANVCLNCHLDTPEKAAAHPIEIGTNTCIVCHNPHTTQAVVASIQGAPHYNNITGGMYPASYVTSKAVCKNCHAATATNSAIRHQWAQSGHAATTGLPWIDYDFKTRSDCVQCHTTTGFIAFSTARVKEAWGVASDKTKEVLSCAGCHSNVAAGVVRTVTPVKPYSDDSYTNPELGPSNVCAGCHSGSLNGNAIKVAASAGADFGNLAFLAPHHMAASGILFKSIGYEFSGKDYSNSWHFRHDRIGINHYSAYGVDTGVDGPCIACHMGSSEKHTFLPVAKDGNGVVTAITNPLCNSCHTGSLSYTANIINSRKIKYADALLALQKVLETRGIHYAADSYPYFFKTATDFSPGNAVTDWGNADTMGAAFNLQLLKRESGGYAHNMVYTKRLLYDAIDFADNGVMDLSTVDTINNLSGLNIDQRANAASFLISLNGVRY